MRKSTFTFLLLIGFLVLTASCVQTQNYLLKDNLFTDSKIIDDGDPTSYQRLIFIEKKRIKFWDRRRDQDGPINFDAYIFEAYFERGNSVLVRVNSEFKNEVEAKEQAEKYSKIIGKLPNFLRGKNLKTITIHKGKKPWGGGNNDILIHVAMYTGEEAKFLEEVAMHEAAHTSLDYQWNGLITELGWIEAQQLDNKFISQYANRFPKREDVAETTNWWIAVRCKRDRISNALYEKIVAAIPNRLKYLDDLNLNTFPLVCDRP